MGVFHEDTFVILTGAAGLVGQNLVAELCRQGFRNILAIDKHKRNLDILQSLHPTVRCLCADMCTPGPWMDAFAKCKRLFLLQAQITGMDYDIF